MTRPRLWTSKRHRLSPLQQWQSLSFLVALDSCKTILQLPTLAPLLGLWRITIASLSSLKFLHQCWVVSGILYLPCLLEMVPFVPMALVFHFLMSSNLKSGQTNPNYYKKKVLDSTHLSQLLGHVSLRALWTHHSIIQHYIYMKLCHGIFLPAAPHCIAETISHEARPPPTAATAHPTPTNADSSLIGSARTAPLRSLQVSGFQM